MRHGEDRQVKDKLKHIHPGHKARYEFAVDRVSGKILDAACGVGYGSKMLMDSGQVTGIDICPEAIDYAREHYSGPDYILHDIETWEAQKFDWVVSFETIEHLKRPELALSAFRASDKLIVSTPNEEVIPFVPEKHRGEYPHQRHYTPEQFEKLLTSCGWKVVDRLGQKMKLSPVSQCNGAFLVWVCE